MARNRKYQSAAIRFGPAIKAFLLCALIGGSGVGYVWQKAQIDELGRQISKREHDLADLQEQNKKLAKALARMVSPKALETQIKDLNLGLVLPQQSQIWRLDMRTDGIKPDGERKYAAQEKRLPVWR
jgi:hypothetical protein